MKYSIITFFFYFLIISLSSCSAFDEPDTGIPINMAVTIDNGDLSLPFDALSSTSPFHIVGYAREKNCKPFYYSFEADAYIGQNGELKWIGATRYWPGEVMVFVAYWPADAKVELDEHGSVINADCALLGVSNAANHLSGNVTLAFSPYRKFEETDWLSGK